jgi:hypothetical protein
VRHVNTQADFLEAADVQKIIVLCESE